MVRYAQQAIAFVAFASFCALLLVANSIRNKSVQEEDAQVAFASRVAVQHPLSLGPSTNAGKRNKNVRLFCWIATVKENHESRARIVKETWARRCDKTVFMSSEEDPSLPSIDLNVTEDRNHLWTKTKAAFQYTFDHYINSYDWFLKADDDTYVIMENLRYFLSNQSSDEAIYFGAKFAVTVAQGFMSGGAGYVLSQKALRKFALEGLKNHSNCFPGDAGNEDEELGKCMEKIGVKAGDSRDPGGLHRFLAEPPGFFFTNENATWLTYYSSYPVEQIHKRLSGCLRNEGFGRTAYEMLAQLQPDCSTST